jgi:hypothetical protein
MGFNPFVSVGDYPGMLNKIATYTFFATLLLVWLLRAEIPVVETVLSKLTISVPLASGLTVPLGTVLPAFVAAFLSRVLKLHDRVSDMLRIRQRFDVAAILLPLAVGSGTALGIGLVRKIREQRIELMRRLFYKYASSSPGKAVIESHYITMALDQWSWYWIVVEASFLALLAAIILLMAGRYLPSSVLLLSVLLAMPLLQIIRHHCEKYALQEVEEILKEPQRRNEIAGALREIQG